MVKLDPSIYGYLILSFCTPVALYIFYFCCEYKDQKRARQIRASSKLRKNEKAALLCQNGVKSQTANEAGHSPVTQVIYSTTNKTFTSEGHDRTVSQTSV